MIWTLTWVEYVATKEDVEDFLTEFPNASYTGYREDLGKYEVELFEEFEAETREEAMILVQDSFPEITEEGIEFGCQNELGESFTNEDL